MFQDIKVSEDLNGKFFDHLKADFSTANGPNQTMTSFLGLDFNVSVLQVINRLNLLLKSLVCVSYRSIPGRWLNQRRISFPFPQC